MVQWALFRTLGAGKVWQSERMNTLVAHARGVLLLLLAARLAADPPRGLAVPAIPFAPRSYVCQRAMVPPRIDGDLDDPVWAKAAWTSDFVDILGDGGPAPRLRTRVKLAWDDHCLYVAAELEEPDVWAYQRLHDSPILRDNDFEMFIDPGGTTSPYFELEINALDAVWDLLLVRPYREGGRVAFTGWDLKGLRSATRIQGTLNRPGDRDHGWTLELALPWRGLTEAEDRRYAAPAPGDRWRINFSRVQWRTRVEGGRYVKEKAASGEPLREDNWVWSPQGLVDMHYPEMWGFVQFSDRPVGSAPEAFALTAADRAQWTLRRAYYAQRNRFAAKGRYASSLEELALGDPDLPPGWTLRLEATATQWAASAVEEGTGRSIRIDQQGRVER
jgi:hypothetical protein